MQKQLKNESEQHDPPRSGGNKALATISEGCSAIRANQRPPGGSITGHHGILTPPRDEKQFMGVWVCVCAMGAAYAPNRA